MQIAVFRHLVSTRLHHTGKGDNDLDICVTYNNVKINQTEFCGNMIFLRALICVASIVQGKINPQISMSTRCLETTQIRGSPE